MALGITKVCGEIWAFNSVANTGGVFFVYVPTGSGDFLRYRFMNAKMLTNGTDTTVPYLVDVARGYCYPGKQKNACVQTLSVATAPDAGTFTITYKGRTTGNLNWNDTAATIQSAIRALNADVDTVLVDGSWAKEFRFYIENASDTPPTTDMSAVSSLTAGGNAVAITVNDGGSGVRNGGTGTLCNTGTDGVMYAEIFANGWKEFTVPTGTKKMRVVFPGISAGRSWTVGFYTGSGKSGLISSATITYDATVRCIVGQWITVPDTAAFVTLTATSGTCYLTGVEFLTSDTPCDPDTAGAIFDDQNAVGVIGGIKDWPVIGPPSIETAIVWNTSDSFDPANIAAGASHRACDTGTVTKNTQNTTGAITAWTATLPGQKTGPVDMIQISNAFKMYLKEGSATQMANATCDYLIDLTGVQIDQRMTVVPAGGLYLFELYGPLVDLPLGTYQYFKFGGEPVVHVNATANLGSTVKSSRITGWGSPARMVVDAIQPDTDTDGLCFAVADKANVSISAGNQKMYIMPYKSGVAGKPYAQSAVFGVRSVILLTDVLNSGYSMLRRPR